MLVANSEGDHKQFPSYITVVLAREMFLLDKKKKGFVNQRGISKLPS